MKLRIKKFNETEQFFRFSPHICKSYGIDFYTQNDFYETKELPNDVVSALGFLSLDEILTRHVYENYDERSISPEDIKQFTWVENDDGTMYKFLKHIHEFN